MTRLGQQLALPVVVLLALSMSVASAASLSMSSQNLTPYRTCIVSGTPTTTTVVIDASIRQASATTNYGTSTTNDVASSLLANRRLYVRFDLTACAPAIPTSATVRLATLRLYASAQPTTCRTVDLFPVAATWAETTITWNNQPFGTTLNNPPTTSRTGTYTIGTPVGCQNRAAGFIVGGTVTSDVAAWVSGISTNYGWMLRDDAESNAIAVSSTYSAKNLTTPAQAPELMISYVTVP